MTTDGPAGQSPPSGGTHELVNVESPKCKYCGSEMEPWKMQHGMSFICGNKACPHETDIVDLIMNMVTGKEEAIAAYNKAWSDFDNANEERND